MVLGQNVSLLTGRAAILRLYFFIKKCVISVYFYFENTILEE